jgi:putative PIN family toxin of toxin-antitoxin system
VPEPKPSVFLDSNVIFSAIYSSKGAPAVILERFIEGRLMVVVSQHVLDEVIRTIKEKLPEALPALRKLLVNAPPEIRKDPTPEEVKHWSGLLDIGDAAIMAAAVTAQPDYFVTGDRHFLENPEIVKRAGLQIVTPAQFLEAWAGEAGHDERG